MKKLTKKQTESLKTALIIILGIVVFFGIIYIVSENTGNRSNDKNSTNESSTQKQDDTNPLLTEGEVLNETEQKDLTAMSYANFKQALNSGEKKFIFLGSEYCGWCLYQQPILKSLVYKYSVDINYLNTGNITNDEYSELASMHSDLENFGTPTFIVIEKGKVTSVDQGARGTIAIKSLLTNYGFISE